MRKLTLFSLVYIITSSFAISKNDRAVDVGTKHKLGYLDESKFYIGDFELALDTNLKVLFDLSNQTFQPNLSRANSISLDQLVFFNPQLNEVNTYNIYYEPYEYNCNYPDAIDVVSYITIEQYAFSSGLFKDSVMGDYQSTPLAYWNSNHKIELLDLYNFSIKNYKAFGHIKQAIYLPKSDLNVLLDDSDSSIYTLNSRDSTIENKKKGLFNQIVLFDSSTFLSNNAIFLYRFDKSLKTLDSLNLSGFSTESLKIRSFNQRIILSDTNHITVFDSNFVSIKDVSIPKLTSHTTIDAINIKDAIYVIYHPLAACGGNFIKKYSTSNLTANNAYKASLRNLAIEKFDYTVLTLTYSGQTFIYQYNTTASINATLRNDGATPINNVDILGQSFKNLNLMPGDSIKISIPDIHDGRYSPSPCESQSFYDYQICACLSTQDSTINTSIYTRACSQVYKITTEVEKTIGNNDWKLYPNPVTDYFYLTNLNKNHSQYSFSIFDALGIVKDVEWKEEGDAIVFNIVNLNQGVYFLNLQSTIGDFHYLKFTK